MGWDEQRSLQTIGGRIYETNCSIILDAVTHKNKREDQLRRTPRDFRKIVANALRLAMGFFDIYCKLPQISNFCITNLSVKR
jgi:hypothetical protein